MHITCLSILLFRGRGGQFATEKSLSTFLQTSFFRSKEQASNVECTTYEVTFSLIVAIKRSPSGTFQGITHIVKVPRANKPFQSRRQISANTLHTLVGFLTGFRLHEFVLNRSRVTQLAALVCARTGLASFSPYTLRTNTFGNPRLTISC